MLLTAPKCVKHERLRAMNHSATAEAFLPLIVLDVTSRGWFQKSGWGLLSGMNLYFNTKQGRSSGGRWCTYSLYSVHWLRLHPLDAPLPRMNRFIHARLVLDASVRPMIAHVRRRPSRIPAEEEAWPTVVMHGFRCAGRGHGDFEHPHKRVFENHFVTSGCGLRCIVSVGKV